jgi:hypothetical protein
MKAKKRARAKKYFTVAEANATLPLVRAIVRDVTELARDLKERQDRLNRVYVAGKEGVDEAHREELQHLKAQAQAEFERGQERMREYVKELQGLGVELKDYMTGLIDFPSRRDDRDVYLCWRLGEPEVAHWHELDAGFQGRRKLMADPARI